jgi:hypothetical protein
LAAVADIEIHYARVFSNPFSKANLLNTAHLEHHIYAIFGLIHIVYFTFCKRNLLPNQPLLQL